MYSTYDVYEELLKRVFGDSNPPHQSLAFGFCKLLGWKPREIAAEQLSALSLENLEERFANEFTQKSRLPGHQVRPSLEPFRNRLKRKLAEVVSERKTRETYPHLFERIVGGTTWQEYYTGNPEADMSHWWYAVKRRVWSEIRREGKGELFELMEEDDRRRLARKA